MMGRPRKKNRQSSVDRLPPDIREKLFELLRDPRVTQLETTARINEILEAEGRPERVSKSAVNRLSIKMDQAGAKIRQSREMAEMWVAKLGAAPQGQVGHLLNEVVRTLAFETAVNLADGDEPVPPKLLKELSIAIERLERAASENVKREEEIRKAERKRLAEETMKAVDEEGKKGPMTSERLRAIIKETYGV